MHSGAKGKSGSTKPKDLKKKPWSTYTKEEVEKLVIKIAKTEASQSNIGIILRDLYGIPSVKTITNKPISKILEEKKMNKDIPEDLLNLIRKEALLIKHLEKNKQDMTAKRGIILIESKINRLARYYKNTNKLPKDWKYDRTKIGLLIS